MSRNSNKTSSIFPIIVLIIAVAGIILYAYNRSTIGANASSDLAMSKEDIKKVVAEVIKDNPEIIISALENYQSKKMKEMELKAKEVIVEKKAELQSSTDSPVVGNPKGDVTVVEFFDYNCGYCKKVNKIVEQLVDSDKNVKVVFRELPILGDMSKKAAKAALAVYVIDPSKFWVFHDGLMDAPSIDDKLIQDLAKKVGIDPSLLNETMEKAKINEELTKTQELAGKIGIRGTPAFIVGDDLLPGAVDLDTLKKKVEEARAKK